MMELQSESESDITMSAASCWRKVVMPGSLFPCLSNTAMAVRPTLLYIWKKAWLIDVLYGIQIEQKLLQKIIQVFLKFSLKKHKLHKLIMTGDSITDECPCVVPSTSAVHHYLHLRYEQPEPRLTVQSIIGILVRRMMLSWACTCRECWGSPTYRGYRLWWWRLC